MWNVTERSQSQIDLLKSLDMLLTFPCILQVMRELGASTCRKYTYI
jgi:hypothetical protein